MPMRPAKHLAVRSTRPGPRLDTRASAAKRGYDRTWRKLRAAIAAVTPAICVDCGRALDSKHMHLDHDRAKARGGTDEAENLKWRCQRCHSVKTAREDGSFGHAPRTG